MTGNEDSNFDSSSVTEVAVKLPDGSVRKQASITLPELDAICAGAGIVRYYVKDGNGATVKPSQFPISDGELVVSEKNEAKVE